MTMLKAREKGRFHTALVRDVRSEQALADHELAGGIGRAWAVADLEGDGRRELVLSDALAVHAIDARAKIAATVPLADARVCAANDLDGDGKVELIVRRKTELLVLDGSLGTIARHEAAGTVQEAIVTDLDRDGVNELILRVGEGQTSGLEVIHFEAAGDQQELNLGYPTDVATAFLAAMERDDLALAASFWHAARRAAFVAKHREKAAFRLPEGARFRQAVQVDHAIVTSEGAPKLRIEMRFEDGRWWIVALDE